MMEFKRIGLSDVQVKFDGEGMKFSGYASKFNGIDSYGDTIMPGAYKVTLKDRERPVRMRWNHYGPVIGKWTTIKEDEKGLYVEGELTPGHRVAEDVYASMKHGAVDGMSIGYRVVAEKQRENVRELHEIQLVEISVVEEPADLGAQVAGVKHLNALIEDLTSYKEAESLMRESAGFSRACAKSLVDRIKSLVLAEQEQKDAASDDALPDIDSIKSLKL